MANLRPPDSDSLPLGSNQTSNQGFHLKDRVKSNSATDVKKIRVKQLTSNSTVDSLKPPKYAPIQNSQQTYPDSSDKEETKNPLALQNRFKARQQNKGGQPVLSPLGQIQSRF